MYISVFILLASFGLGMGILGPNHRERFMNNETRIELVEKKADESDAEEEEIKE